ncbi:MAG: phosphoribosylglycinamide formyltransferase, partial [Bacteroidetes bacterium]
MKKIIIFISGRGSNMKAILEAVDHGVLQNKAQVQAVFSNNPEAAGLVTAGKRGIKTHVIASQGKKREDYDRALMAWLETQDFDYIVLAGYMRIISPFLVKAYRGR